MDSRDIILNNPDIQDLLDQFHGEKNREKIIQWFIHRTRIARLLHGEYRVSIARPTRAPDRLGLPFDIQEQLRQYEDAMRASSGVAIPNPYDIEDYFERVGRFEQERDAVAAASSSRQETRNIFGRSLAEWGRW